MNSVIRTISLGFVSSILSILPLFHAQAQSQVSSYETAFADAAKEYSVPENLLKAISYTSTRWSANGGEQSLDGGYGMMDLTTPGASTTNGKGDDTTSNPTTALKLSHYTLDEASGLLRQPAAVLKTDQVQNIRGGAAVLASYERQQTGGLAPDPAQWYGALASYSGSTNQTAATGFADDVYQTLKAGAQSTDDSNLALAITATPGIQPDSAQASQLFPQSAAAASTHKSTAECPSGLNCRFIPAGYGQNDSNPADYGNYDPANRPTDMKIQYIIIHSTEGTYNSTINYFQDTNAYVSAHYVIRSSDGAITQMVRDQDVSWGAADWYINMHGINIEHEGFAAQGAKWFTPAMYQSSASLVRWLANKYAIPLDRNHIIGHDNASAPSNDTLVAQHWDPGPFWDWNRYLSLVQGTPIMRPTAANMSAESDPKYVYIAPDFASNKPAITDCSSQPGSCRQLPSQGTSIVYLRTKPSSSAPFINDQVLNPKGTASTNEVSDWGATASAGEEYLLADQQGSWVAIWFGGQKAWFNNPSSQPTALFLSTLSRIPTITPKAGKTSIPVYGRPTPEASAYPKGVTPVAITPLNYTLKAGQSYVAVSGLTNDYFYDATFDYSLPHDHEIFVGNTVYYQVQLNHRLAYVKASDIALTND